MGNSRVHAEAKKSTTLSPAVTLQRSHLLQRNPDETDRETIQAKSYSSSEPFSTLSLSVGHSFGEVSAQAISVPLQPKLTIGQPNDPHEQEADRVADQVMRMPEPKIQRVCPECKDELQRQPMVDEEQKNEEKTLQTKPIAETITPRIQRQTEPTEEEKKEEEPLQTKTASGEAATVSSALQNQITALQGGGQPLPQSERHFFEPRFGTNFSQVRVHSSSQAAEVARAVNARAFTLGQDVVFGAGQFASGTHEGRHLIAHELTHVLQQSGVNKIHRGQSNEKQSLASQAISSAIQRDLAIDPPSPNAVGRVLTPAQMTAAIAFNNQVLGAIANSADIIERIRDVIGVSPLPAIIDEDFINGVVQWQANFRLAQDGKLGPATARPLFREIGAEGGGRGELSQNPRYTPAGPINVASAGARQAPFDMSATFKSDPANGIFPSCCEVRQDIQWDAAFVTTSVAAGNGTVPHTGFPAAHPANTWIEDRDQAGGRYGHRTGIHSDPGSGDQYLDSAGQQNQAFGHRFRGQDTPTGLPGDRGSWRFRLRVIDVCNGNQLLAVSPTLVVNWL